MPSGSGTDLEEDEAVDRTGGGGEVAAERGDEAVAVPGVELHRHHRRGEGGSGGGRHGWEPHSGWGCNLLEKSLCGPSNATQESKPNKWNSN